MSCATRTASSIGIANPSPIEPACAPAEDWPRLAIDELMPMTWPSASTSGPPELPGLTAASVWIASVTAVWPSSPLAATGRSAR